MIKEIIQTFILTGIAYILSTIFIAQKDDIFSWLQKLTYKSEMTIQDALWEVGAFIIIYIILEALISR